ncbi:MAG: hypothetical protein GY719_34685 [bacterium]|nr:hypothetical protein [bacterium]
MLLEGAEGTALLILAVATWPLSRWLLGDLGSRPDERRRAWPGDRLVPKIDRRATRAVTIRAPAAAVWPWLLQLGLDRGGFHSYELLERLGGIDVRNVESILPDLEPLEIGREILLHPEAPGIWVTLLKPHEHLCFRTWKDERDLADRDPVTAASWSLYLVAESAGSCRLLLRACKHHRRPRPLRARLLAALLEDPLDLVMEQRMLRTIRRLAERPTARRCRTVGVPPVS